MEQHLTDVLIFYYMGDLQELGLLRFSLNMVDYPIHYIGRVEKNMYLQDTHKT